MTDLGKDWTRVICLAVNHSNHYTRRFSVFVWGCNWTLFMHGWFCLIHLIHPIGWKSLHFEKLEYLVEGSFGQNFSGRKFSSFVLEHKVQFIMKMIFTVDVRAKCAHFRAVSLLMKLIDLLLVKIILVVV